MNKPTIKTYEYSAAYQWNTDERQLNIQLTKTDMETMESTSVSMPLTTLNEICAMLNNKAKEIIKNLKSLQNYEQNS